METIEFQAKGKKPRVTSPHLPLHLPSEEELQTIQFRRHIARISQAWNIPPIMVRAPYGIHVDPKYLCWRRF